MIPLGNDVMMVTRVEWGARTPESRTSFTADQGTTAHWEGPHMGDFPHSSCFAKVRGIQNYHMDSQGWTDIAYTCLVCPHGYVFEGRWINVRTAANGTTAGNDGWYAVCFLGGEGDPFPDPAKRAMGTVFDWLDLNGAAGPGENCHRDHKNTACPGDAICGWVRSGTPIPGLPPAPTPEPIPPHLEDDFMIMYVPKAGNRPTRLLSGGRAADLGPGDFDALVAKGVERIQLSPEGYEAWDAAFYGPVDTE